MRSRLKAFSVAMAAMIVSAGALGAQQQPNTAESLLTQCQAYVAEDSEVMSRMTCENTIWSTMKAMEVSKTLDASFKAPYCRPEAHDISVREAATLFVAYVNLHPDVLHLPAEHAVLMALRNSYPCAG